MVKAALGLGAIVLAVACTTEVIAQEGDSDVFEVGGSCAVLAYLDASQLRQFTSSAYSDDFHSFCYPEEPLSCSDYTSFLKGVGRMVMGDDGYHCSLQLQ